MRHAVHPQGHSLCNCSLDSCTPHSSTAPAPLQPPKTWHAQLQDTAWAACPHTRTTTGCTWSGSLKEAASQSCCAYACAPSGRRAPCPRQWHPAQLHPAVSHGRPMRLTRVRFQSRMVWVFFQRAVWRMLRLDGPWLTNRSGPHWAKKALRGPVTICAETVPCSQSPSDTNAEAPAQPTQSHPSRRLNMQGFYFANTITSSDAVQAAAPTQHEQPTGAAGRRLVGRHQQEVVPHVALGRAATRLHQGRVLLDAWSGCVLQR